MECNQHWLIDKYFVSSEPQGQSILSAFKQLSNVSLVGLERTKRITDVLQKPSADIIGVIGSIAFNQWVTRSYKGESYCHTFMSGDFAHYHRFMKWVPESMRLNRGGFLLPLSMIVENSQRLYWSFGERVFIRPDQSLKVAEARVCETSRSALMTLTNTLLRHSGASEDTLFWCFPEKNIRAEWRCWVQSGQIVGISSYSHLDAKQPVTTGMTTEARLFAKKVAKQIARNGPEYIGYEPYVLDIALSEDGYHAIELNSASSSGWYDLPVFDCAESCVDGLDKTFFSLGC